MDLSKSKSSRRPIYSREMTLEAHFTFASPSSSTYTKMVSSETAAKANVSTPTSPPLVSMTPRMSSSSREVGDSWQWSKDGAHCSVFCGKHALQMQYDASTDNDVRHRDERKPPHSNIETGNSLAFKVSSITDGHHESTHTILHSPESGSKESRVHVARPYERRCKSTAHIVLQNNTKSDEQRPKEFHGSTDLEDLSNRVKYQNVNDYAHDPPNVHHMHHYQQPYYDYRCYPTTSMCSCPHCSTLHSLMTSLRCELPCRCQCQHHDVSHKKVVKLVSPQSQTFNSHRSYETPLFAKYCKGGRSLAVNRRLDTPVPSSRSPSPEGTSTPQHKRFVRRDSYTVEKKSMQEKESRKKKRSKKGRRPRTIHIDVYCSTSSSSENDSDFSNNSSTSTIGEESSHKKSSEGRTLVALGSKKNQYKNNFQLQSRSLERVVGFDKKNKSDAVSNESTPKIDARAFITDHPLSLCSSPSTPLERPVSSPPQVNSDRYSLEEARKNVTDLLLPSPPKPKTLRVSPVFQEFDLQKQERQRKVNEDLCSHSLGSSVNEELESAVLSQLDANLLDLPIAFSDLYMEDEDEKGYRNDDIFIRPWRSPELERRKYLTSLENRDILYQDKETQHSSDFGESEHLKTPTEAFELAKLSVFKDFSEEELQVISKSLTRRESERSTASRHSGVSLSRHSSFRYPRTSSPKSNKSSLYSVSSKDIISGNKNTKRGISEEARKFLEDLKQSDKSSRTCSQDNNWNSLPCRGKTRQSDVSHYQSKQTTDDFAVSSHKLPNKGEVSKNNVSSSKRQSTGSRLINVGHFKRLDRFPFSTYTYPGPYQSHPSTALSDDDRRFVRPNVFGETLKTNRRHGIHFGPPRNPQCSCVSCRVWRINSNQRTGGSKEDSPPRPRSYSLSELSHRSHSSSSSSSVKNYS